MSQQAVNGGWAVPGPPRSRFPVLPLSYVPRPQLWERLDVASEGAVTQLVAPAGAGKTLGVAGWLRTRDRVESSVWVSASDSLDPATLEDLMRPGASKQLLVLDDAHLLPRATLDHIDDLLAEDPDRLSLMLLSRWDLSLTRLVPELLGHLTVLRGGVLRLDRPEVEALVAHHARTRDAEVVDAVAELAQGWCAVAVLAAKSVGADRDPRAAAGRLLEGRTSAVDRIMGEAYAALTPPQRHLLLCVVGDARVTAMTARHLSQDDDAQRRLDDLVSTGLLVTRHEHLPRTDRPPALANEVTFEVHPLLREIVQRRVRTGAIDVTRARASVLRAVRNDAAQGDTAGAFRRLHAMDATDDVLDLLADRGIDLAVAGHLEGLVEFVRRNTSALEQRPLVCLAVALERWLAGDPGTARRWWERVLRAGQQPAPGPRPEDDSDVSLAKACAVVLLARTGNAGLEGAVDAATAELVRAEPGVREHSLAQLLRLETGILQLRLGRVRAAERMLSSVVSGTATGDDPLAVAATAQLALAQYLEGRERACLELAEGALRDTRRLSGPPMSLTRRTVNVARGLAAIQRLVGPERLTIAEEGFDELPTVRSIDPVVDCLERLLRARALLLRGAAARAEQVLSLGLVLDELPAPVVRLVAFEQALLALLASDWDRMASLEALLSSRDGAAEAALVAGLRADGMGDSRTADQLYAVAAVRADAAQPPTEAMALACRAQLLDAEGRHEAARTALASAVAATQGRRSALPFLGWSRHGTPMAALLRQLTDELDDDWLRKLVADTATAPGGVFASASIVTATPRERAQVPDGVVRPSLSLRERDVLQGLARGSTYADIAANLFVSENTVKTHVSSLYAKLAVGRRSDALAVARTLRLL